MPVFTCVLYRQKLAIHRTGNDYAAYRTEKQIARGLRMSFYRVYDVFFVREQDVLKSKLIIVLHDELLNCKRWVVGSESLSLYREFVSQSFKQHRCSLHIWDILLQFVCVYCSAIYSGYGRKLIQRQVLFFSNRSDLLSKIAHDVLLSTSSEGGKQAEL